VAFSRDEERVRAERARAIGLFRYSLISEPANAKLSTRQRGRLVRAIADREHDGPFGQPVRVSRATLDRWLRDWRRGGFDALVPTPPKVSPRTPGDVLELAVALKKEVPERTAVQVAGDPAGPLRLVTGRADVATPLRAPGTEHTAERVAAEGVRPVRGRRAE
jgi:putative transposase